MQQIYSYFPPYELRCHCGQCGRNQDDMNIAFMRKLMDLRDECGFVFNVTSSIRCPEYNAQLSPKKSRTGAHTEGRAVDIAVSGKEAFQIVAKAKKFGFTGIGVNQRGPHDQRFIHLDDMDHQTRPWIWSY